MTNNALPPGPVGSKSRMMSDGELKILARYGRDGLERWSMMMQHVGDIKCNPDATEDERTMADVMAGQVAEMDNGAGIANE